MVLHFVVGGCLLLAASIAYGNELQVDYEGQVPDNVVIEGLPITYSFENTNVDDGIGQASDGIGTGMRIKVNGSVVPASSGVFTSDGCIVDPIYSDFWACHDLWPGPGDSQEYSFTWTPPASGSYLMDFYGLCQEMPVPDPPRYCRVNDDIPTVAYFYTTVSPDTDGDGVSDGDDPDDDNDGITDDLDTQPLVPSNHCSNSDGDHATVALNVVGDVTCAARVSIAVHGATKVWGPLSPAAHLRLIAPRIRFEGGFEVQEGGLLSVISGDPCPGCVYTVGGTGPAGGLVFYVTDGGIHGLEAAPDDQADAPWGCHGTLTGINGTAIGAGEQNTTMILEACGERPIAASVAFDYSINGFDDWFLPSRDELSLMYWNLHVAGLGGFANDAYWTSSENVSVVAWIHAFYNDFPHGGTKESAFRVRAVRAF